MYVFRIYIYGLESTVRIVANTIERISPTKVKVNNSIEIDFNNEILDMWLSSEFTA